MLNLFACFFYLCSEPAAETAEDAPLAPASQEEAGESGAGPSSNGGTTPEDIIAWFNTTVKDYDALFLVYYRGLW